MHESHSLVGTKVCPIGYMNDLYESVKEADKVQKLPLEHHIEI
jgi:hypothetical protein